MHKIILLPQIGLSIVGIGQINFGDSRDKLIEILGQYQSISRKNDKRVEYANDVFLTILKKMTILLKR